MIRFRSVEKQFRHAHVRACWNNDYSSKMRRPTRRGAILIAAIAAFAVFSMLAAVAVGFALRAHRACKTERDLLQLEFLCEAGLMRAVQKLSEDGGYIGEDWLELPSGNSGKMMRVTIRVSESSSTDATENESLPKVIDVQSKMIGRSRAPISMQRTRTTKYSMK
ncbi:MAG: hypothetical protein FJ308_14410 [Planctomycetes bacterium]|nr:hypothetical protein [Planctomycetota bacterium]